MNKKSMAIWRRIPRKSSRLGWRLCVILLVSLTGCGNTSTVTGKVSYQGRTACHGSVLLRSADKSICTGNISLDGSYRVEGVPRGTVEIGVISRDPSKGHSMKRDGKRVHPDNIQGWFPLPARFETPEASGLHCTVDAGTVSYDIDLK
jgi:hypothetical protein